MYKNNFTDDEKKLIQESISIVGKKSPLKDSIIQKLSINNEANWKIPHLLTMVYRSQLTIFSIDNQHEKGSMKNATGWSTIAFFPHYYDNE